MKKILSQLCVPLSEARVEALLKIQDAYPKIVIARTRHDTYQYEGIEIIDIVNWLIED